MSLSETITSLTAQVQAGAEQRMQDRMNAVLQAGIQTPTNEDESTSVYSVTHKTNQYRLNHIQTHYLYDNGKIVLRSANPDGDVVTCAAKAAIGFAIVEWVAERHDIPPELPNTNMPEELNAEFLNSHIVQASIAVSADSVDKMYFTSGVYLYLIHNPVIPGESEIPVPSAPCFSSKEENIKTDHYVDVFKNAIAEG